MKVYVITKGSYSDYHICAVTLDEQEAERLAKIHTDSWDTADVEEWDTDEHQHLLCGRLPYVVTFHAGYYHPRNGQYITEKTDFNRYTGSRKDFTPRVCLNDRKDTVYLYAAGSEAAVKIAAEKRAQARAEKEGLT